LHLYRDYDAPYLTETLAQSSRSLDETDCSRISTQQYKSAPENLSEIAKQLGVAHILEGSVQKSGDVVRVNVQLFKAANDDDADALVCNQ
jgi:TolB-like protein